MNTQTVTLNRNRRGWSAEVIQKWDGWPNPTTTNSGGYSSLRWAVFTLASSAADSDTAIMEIVASGKALSREDAEKMIVSYADGNLGYAVQGSLRAIKELQ